MVDRYRIWPEGFAAHMRPAKPVDMVFADEHDAEIAALKAKNERLTKEAESYRAIAARKSNQVAEMIRAEALSSTGAVKPRAYIVHAPEDDYYGTGPDRLQFHPLAQHDMDNGYRQTPLYGRPAEQAVTDEIVAKVSHGFLKKWGFPIAEHFIRDILKAAMEAGHD